MIVLAVYAPTSPQRLLDVARLAFSSSVVDILAVIRPSAMAAQVGVPEVGKLAYKTGRRLAILPQIQDLSEVMGVSTIAFLVHDESAYSLEEVLKESGESIAIVIQGGDTPFTKGDLALGKPVKHSMPEIPPIPAADAALVIETVARIKRVHGSM